jgi:LPS export ABC transporter protein LptC
MAKYAQGDTTYVVLQSHADTTRTPVTASLFDETGAATSTVHARRLIYHDQSRRFEARGGVVVETHDGKRLESEVLFWNEADRQVRTPGFTRITTPTEQIQGYGLVADENLDTYSLARITGQVTVEDE